MRFLIFLLLLIFVVAGVLFGALNPGMTTYDLGAAMVTAPRGAALLVVLVAGWLLGGLTAWAGSRGLSLRSRRHEKPGTDRKT